MNRPCETGQHLSPSAPHLPITIQWLVAEMQWTLKAPALFELDTVQSVCFSRILAPLVGHLEYLTVSSLLLIDSWHDDLAFQLVV